MYRRGAPGLQFRMDDVRSRYETGNALICGVIHAMAHMAQINSVRDLRQVVMGSEIDDFPSRTAYFSASIACRNFPAIFTVWHDLPPFSPLFPVCARRELLRQCAESI